MQDSSSLLTMQAREYSSATGQFFFNDPLGIRGGEVNIRQYVGNNPVRAVDPGGLDFGATNANDYFGLGTGVLGSFADARGAARRLPECWGGPGW